MKKDLITKVDEELLGELIENIKTECIREHSKKLNVTINQFKKEFGEVIDILPEGDHYILLMYENKDIYAYRREKDGKFTIIHLNDE